MERNKNIDLLRIIAILFITTWHSFLFSAYGMNVDLQLLIESHNTAAFFLCSFSNLLIIGVNIFFLISGYCGIQFSVKKIARIVFESIAVYTICALINLIQKSPDISIGFVFYSLSDCIFCIRKYWYVNVYILLMIGSSFLNLILENISFRKFIYFFLVFTFLSGIVYFVFELPETGLNKGYSIVSACGLYIIGGGIYKFKDELKDKLLPLSKGNSVRQKMNMGGG